MSAIEIISASAGSGKTFRLTELLEDGVVNQAVRPYAVLATSFTDKSAAELQERVRVRLLEAGRIAEAQQLTAARIGTVNAVCGRLVNDFAFELGLSPELRVLDKEPAELALKRAVSKALTPDEEAELAELTERMEAFQWQDAVGRIVASARANEIHAAALKAMGTRSWKEFQAFLGSPAKSAAAMDQALLKAMEKFLAEAGKNNDSTKTTREAIDRVHQHLDQLKRGVVLRWKDWVALSHLKTGKKSDALMEPVRVAARAQDQHPKLHSDLKRAIELAFDLAARAMNIYQEQKRENGVIDFVDQESFALELLNRPEVREQLAGELDLVLIDEFQDTSPIQLAIFLRLADIARRSVWVGDQKQSIYGFRSADPSLMDAAIEEILHGTEPESLPKSYRSRPGLVDFTSTLFIPAFAQQGIPQSRVALTAASKKEPEGLGPFMECWQLQSKNKEEDAAAVAAATKAFLEDTSVRVRDRKDGTIRPPRASDIAILCLTNDRCQAVAEELAALAIRPVLPRYGLMMTLEGRTALAGLRLWVDGRDTLATAELARLVNYAGRENDWLKAVLEAPGAKAFADISPVAALRQGREREPNLGVVAAFDAAVEALGLMELCHCWGDCDARLANIEALRGHVIQYSSACATGGTGCTPAGLVGYLIGLQEAGIDSQGVDEDDHAVVVSTWHGAKGLEWPVVVLFPMARGQSALAALGVKVQSDRDKLQLSDPLAERWLRFWPYPYDIKNNDTPFHHRLADHKATAVAQLQEERENLRLLYMGWTRARDRIVLADREGKITGGILQLLRDDKQVLLTEPGDGKISWAGPSIDVQIRRAGPLPPQTIAPTPGSSYAMPGIRVFPAAFMQPSGLMGSDLQLKRVEQVGKRIAVQGNCDWNHLGLALHGFFCADRMGLDSKIREVLLAELLQRWGVQTTVETPDIVSAADALRRWVITKWPDAIWCREWPVLYRDEGGSVIRGSSDLVLKVSGGLILLDHKSFPGSIPQALIRVAEYAGQLGSYSKAIEAATKQKVLSMWVHLPISGIAVPLEG